MNNIGPSLKSSVNAMLNFVNVLIIEKYLFGNYGKTPSKHMILMFLRNILKIF